MSETLSKEAEEGKMAKAEGKPMEANPYRAGSQESADWLAGYTADERTEIGEDKEDDDT